jgi:LysM repeat protein
MCTVSHCHQILPGYYRFKRCEQHRLQNRHHSKLKRVREKEEKAIGPKEGATVVEIPPEAAETHPSKKNASHKAAAEGEQVSESKTKRAKVSSPFTF